MRTIVQCTAVTTLLTGVCLTVATGQPELLPNTSSNEAEHPSFPTELTFSTTMKELTTVPDAGDAVHQPDGAGLKAARTACLMQANVNESTDFTCNRSLLVHYSLMEFWTHHGSVEMCQREGDYKKAMECVLEASKGCLPPENVRHFPDIDNARAGLQYICGVHQMFDVDKSCARRHFPEVFDCVQHDTLLLVDDDYLQIPIQPHLICRTYDIADLCCWEKLQVCGSLTAAAYTRVMSLYLRPPSCRSSAAETAFINLAVFLVALMISVLMPRG